MEKENKLNETLQFYAKLFFTNFQMESREQLSNMVSSAISFGEYFYDEKEDVNNCEKEVKLLNEIYCDPVKIVLKEFKGAFTPKRKKRLMQGKTLAGIEWIFYRDTRYNTPLKREYYVDEAKPKSKYVTLQDIVDVRGYLKIIIGKQFTAMAKRNDVAFAPYMLPDIVNQPLAQVGEK